MKLISRLIFFVLLFFSYSYSEDNLSFSITNDEERKNYQFDTPSIQYEKKKLSGFSSVGSKVNSAFLYPRSYGSIGQVNTISIDGGLSSHTRIGWDGLNIEIPQMSSIDVSLLPLEFAESVEIYRENLTPYGVYGQAGFLNFLPHSSTKNGLIDIFTQSYDTYGGKLLLHSINNDMKGDMGFSLISSSNNFHYLDRYGLTNTAENLDFIRYSLFSKFYFPLVSFSVAHTYRDSGTGRTYNLSPRQKDIFTVLKFDSEIFDTYFKAGVINWDNIYTTRSDDSDLHNNRTFSIELEKNLEIFALKNQFKPSLKYFTVKSTKIGEKTLWHSDLSYTGKYSLWKLDFAFSSDLIYREGYDFYIVPGGSLSFNAFDSVKFYGSISRGLLFPSFNDLYWPSDSFATGNSNLVPEDGIRWQGGVVWLFFPLYFNLCYTESYIDNQILWQPSAGGIWQPQNIGKVFARVFNFIGRYEDVIFDFKTTAEISFSYNYSINNDSNSIYYHKRIMYVPLYKWGASFSVEYREIFKLALGYRYLSERFINEENSLWLKPYGLMDIELGLYVFYLAVENLFDVGYQDVNGYPQMGRSFKGGLRIEF
ncbi:MAG: TonB-dependent receptor domain-containing protein [Brevinematia bacterium]